MSRFLASIAVALGALILAGPARAQDAAARMAVEIYKELLEINTVTSRGDTAQAADAMAARLRAAGYGDAELQLFKPAERKGNLVVRLRGSGARKPMLLLAHIDVVEALREDWSVDPFVLTEKDGYFYARGSGDDKFMAAAFVANMIRYKQEGYKPDRDIILALETDEEILDRNQVGIQWLLQHHRDLIDAEFAFNEGGGVGLKNGKPIRNTVQTMEKVSMTFTLEITDRGGHSSVPRKDNPIYRLSEALVRLSKYEFPFRLNATTRAYFERMAEMESPQTAADMRSVIAERPDLPALSLTRLSANPAYNAQLRTTCVATMLQGGHAGNALPQLARATVNCRALPGATPDEIRDTLVQIVADDHITVAAVGKPVLSAPSELHEEIMGAIKTLTAEFWPGVPVVPVMSTGATDGSYLRNAGIPTYGHSGLAGDVDDIRAHGRDERVLVKSFHDGREYLYRLVKMLAGGK